MEYKFTKQLNNYDCGIAVCTMIINFYQNKNFNIEEIKFSNSLSDDMLSIYNIEEILQKYKIEFTSYSSSFEELTNIDFSNPLIVNTKTEDNSEHFIIIYKKRKNNFLIADPNNNDLKWITKEELKLIYQGYFGFTKRIEKIKFKSNNFLNWFFFIRGFKLAILLIFIISLLSNLFILINNNFLKIYLNNVKINILKIQQEIFIIFIIVFLFQILITYFLNKVLNNIKIKINENIFNSFKNSLIELDIENFNSISKEEWTKKLFHINVMSDFIVFICLKLPLETPLFLMCSIILTIIFSIILFIIILQNFLTLIISFFVTYLIKEYKLKMEKNILNFLYTFRELLNGFEEIKYKNIEKKISSEIDKKFNKTLDTSKKIFKLNSKSSMAITIVNKLFFFIIFFIAYILINKN
nr:cysteine peptidase family C39 domain-containing protein [Spiroplasma taiwanense]